MGGAVDGLGGKRDVYVEKQRDGGVEVSACSDQSEKDSENRPIPPKNLSNNRI